MDGKIDSSFVTQQRDMFTSGVAAEIGMNAYGVWTAIKFHADYETGKSWPGMRRLGELTGLSKSTVDRCIDVLEKAHLLRVAKREKGRGLEYVARERLAVRVGSRILCTIVIDYVPNKMRERLNRIEEALATGEKDIEAFAQVEIIPGDGFKWDAQAGVLRAEIPAKDIPPSANTDDEYHRKVGEAMLARMAPAASKKLSRR
jgi:DNA-binding transcriptional ArsR family regulator